MFSEPPITVASFLASSTVFILNTSWQLRNSAFFSQSNVSAAPAITASLWRDPWPIIPSDITNQMTICDPGQSTRKFQGETVVKFSDYNSSAAKESSAHQRMSSKVYRRFEPGKGKALLGEESTDLCITS